MNLNKIEVWADQVAENQSKNSVTFEESMIIFKFVRTGHWNTFFIVTISQFCPGTKRSETPFLFSFASHHVTKSMIFNKRSKTEKLFQ